VDYQPQTIDYYLRILKRRKWHFVLPAAVLAVIAILAATLVPPLYRSQATILIEQQEIPTDLVRTTVTSFANARIELISKRIMSTPNLSAIIERHGLYKDVREQQSIGAAAEKMRKAIALEIINAEVIDPTSGRPEEATIAFSLAYENRSPEVAQQITNELVSLFLDENIQQRQAAVEEASVFLGVEAERLGEQLSVIEARIAEFKERNRDNLPEFAGINRELMARTEEKLRDNAQAMRALSEQQLYLESELAQLSPTGTSADPLSSPAARLQELETQYVAVAARYSRDHPDRIQMEKEISALRSEVGQAGIAAIQSRLEELKGQLSVLRERYSDTHPDVSAVKRSIAATEAELAAARRRGGAGGPRGGATAAATNPAYVDIRTRLEATRLEIKALEAAREELQAELERLEERITDSPRIEQEYKSLMRDYDNAMAKYKEVRDKEMQAELAKALEADRKGERFTLLEPPMVPLKPEKPNRPAILLIGMVLAMGAGFGNVALQQALDNGVYGVRGVTEATGAPPLAVIPVIETGADRRGGRRRALLWTLAIGLSLAAGAALVHFLWVPLDTLWIKATSGIPNLAPQGASTKH
jgi:uncharacterized protein involved in exopolysaccharide biosynthesis